MAKKVEGYIKLQIPAGKATPAPPVGPALGQHGVNIVEFTKQFNAKTADQGDLIIPVVITVYADRSFSFITKTPPAPVLIKKACKIQSGSGEPNKKKVAKITKAQVQEIAELKMPDLNAASLESAMSMIAVQQDQWVLKWLLTLSETERATRWLRLVCNRSLRLAKASPPFGRSLNLAKRTYP